MNIEDVIFKKYVPDFDKLIKYGFKTEDHKTLQLFSNHLPIVLEYECD